MIQTIIILLILLGIGNIYRNKLKTIDFTIKTTFFKKVSPSNYHFLLNIIVISLVSYLLNKIFQVYCQPVIWAGILLISVMLSFSFLKTYEKFLTIKILMRILQGIGFFISVYCIYFLQLWFIANILIAFLTILISYLFYKEKFIENQIDNTFFSTFLFNLGLAFISPIYFIYLTIREFINSDIIGKILIPLSAISILLIFLIFSFKYRELANRISKFNVEQIFKNLEIKREIQNSYLGERIVGMHLKFHTRYHEYDGWRPPLHDPFLIFALWINDYFDPLANYSYDDRIKLYETLFPKKNLQANCSCAFSNSKFYWNDKIFKK